jgi:transcriptional regulator with XRE-family HTH domain
MDPQWERLGAAVKKARKERRITQPRLGELVGVSRTVIQNIESGRAYAKVTGSLRDLEVALGWKRGSIEAILDGGDPIPAGEANSTADGAVAVNTEGLPMRIAQTLAEGATLDTTIVPLSADAQMVVIVKGKPNADPAQLRAALEEWERKEGHLRRLGLTPTEPIHSEQEVRD